MKTLTSIAYKTLTALMIVMLALSALPVSPAYAATSGPNSPTLPQWLLTAFARMFPLAQMPFGHFI